MKKTFLIVLAILLVAAPIIFVWHAEMVTDYTDQAYEGTFTNGFYNIHPIKVYHLQMYFLFLVNAVGAGCIIYNLKYMSK